jgi:murein L,D-transpeptidase YafK
MPGTTPAAMRALRIRTAILVCALVVLAGCAGVLGTRTAERAPAPSSAGSAVRVIDADSTTLPWARNEGHFIVVSRSCKQLDVFYRGHLIRRFPVVFGRNPEGSKLYEGDRRTPNGFYAIVEKRKHARWARFMLLDYPNTSDLQRYSSAMADGRLPLEDEQIPGVGGAIGIHGSDKDDLNARGVDWTFGCISMMNEAVVELDTLVPVGTPVLISE